MRNEAWIPARLADLRAASLERTLTPLPAVGGRITIDGREFLNFASNDYLDFARRPELREAVRAAADRFGAGATASRLMAGTLSCHAELEARLAAFKGYPAALVFGSGYLTNVGALPALVGRNDMVFADKLAHASLIDGAVLSRARLVRFHHNDAAHLERQLAAAPAAARKLVVTESVFSMDGDRAPLPDLCGVAQRHGAMVLVDGLENAVNISMGTLSKALGSYGGFAAVSAPMRDWLVNTARSFIFDTALPPAAAAAALAALGLLERSPGLGSELLRRAKHFRASLRNAGLALDESESQIVPVVVGSSAGALSLSRRLRERGILAPAVRPPTVPEGTARLRFSVTLAHREEDLDHAAASLRAAMAEEGLLP
jgi:7-keto-8-aminopelargonate synthetase-like enzyme